MTSIALSSRSYDNIQVDWVEPEDCEVDGYMVTYQLINQDQCLPVEGDVLQEGTTDTRILLRALEAYSTYEVGVLAIADSIEGEIETASGITSESGIHI